MSSVPSNVAAHATATSAPDHPVWFQLQSWPSYYRTLFAVFSVCVCGAMVFFLRALRPCSSPALPRSALRSPPALSSPPPPFLSSLPSAPVTPRPGSPFPRLPFPPFAVALLGHALKLLVSTRACCYVFGQAHTYISFFPAFSLFSCYAFFFVTVSGLVPLFPPPFPCRSPSFARTLCLLGARTQAPPPTHALCHLLFLAPLPSAFFSVVPGSASLCTHDAPFVVWYSLYLATPKSRRVVLMHPCHLIFMCWFVYSLYLATPKSRRVILMRS